MTYGINSKSHVGPDAEPSTRRLNWVFPWFVRRWAKTQRATTLEQLDMGIRYFDLRVGEEDNKLYYTHGLFAMEVFEPLYEIKLFLLKHPQEVIIIDFQHFYQLQVWNHMQLHNQLLQVFEGMLFSSNDGNLQDFTLNRCISLGRQILIIYRRCPIQLPAEFWPSNMFPNPWPNVASCKKLTEYLTNSLDTRRSWQGYVSQCVITPTGRYIALRYYLIY